jgi:hypothetical protein
LHFIRTYVLDLQGNPRGRFKRAIERRSLLNAELAAREMGTGRSRKRCSSSCSTRSRLIRGPSVRWLGGSAGGSPRNSWGSRWRRNASSSSRLYEDPTLIERRALWLRSPLIDRG